MSLNFFTSNAQKTDAKLTFKSVIDNLTENQDISTPLDIDQFIQQENIQLGQHQDFYKEPNSKGNTPPKSISKDNDLTKQDTRVLVNSLLELSKTMPEIKAKALEHNGKIRVALEQNEHTIEDINHINL